MATVSSVTTVGVQVAGIIVSGAAAAGRRARCGGRRQGRQDAMRPRRLRVGAGRRQGLPGRRVKATGRPRAAGT